MLFRRALLLALCSPVFAYALNPGDVMRQEICEQILPFAKTHQIEVSEIDLYHCHTVLQLEKGEEKAYTNDHTWSYLEPRRWAYVCHAHEKDGLRTEKDNFNIFWRNGAIGFWGVRYPVREEDVLERFYLDPQLYATTWTNIYFYPKNSERCAPLSESKIMTCAGQEICLGLENSGPGFLIQNPKGLIP